MKIIALGHRLFVGKNTAASCIQEICTGRHVRQYSFAAPLKEDCHRRFSRWGLMDARYYEQHSDLKDVVLPQIGMSPRQIWIEYGTTFARAVHPDVWAYAATETIESNQADVSILTDLRFPNEVQAVREAGGIVVRIDNPRVPHQNNVADKALANYTEWDVVVQNSGTIAELKDELTRVMRVYNLC